ncbi:MAG: hypothetical protein JXA21_23105 [Anaerolineae bacterium]|nr:hypothetical protein [Anaerolineae bacterium]
MDYGKILRRAWKILWEYRALWILGMILALTTGSPGSQSSYTLNDRKAPNGGPVVTPPEGTNIDSFEEFWDELEKLDRNTFVEALEDEGVPTEVIPLIIGIGIGLLSLLLVVGVIMTILRFIAQGAMIRMVNDYEDTGEKMPLRQGWRAGRSRAWRLFLISLTVGIPQVVVFLVLLLLALLPLFLWSQGEAAGILGTIITVGLVFLLVFFAIIVAAIIELLKQFFRRVCVLEHTGVRESIRQGYGLAKQNWKSAGIMWLIIAGINLIWTVIFVPVTILVLIISLIIGGGVGAVFYGILQFVFTGLVAPIIAGVIALLLLILTMAALLGFLGSFREVYISIVWTLCYRDLRALRDLGSENAYSKPWESEEASSETWKPDESGSESWKAEME